MLDYYTLKLNSKDEDDKPVAMKGKDIIYLAKSKVPTKNTQIVSTKHDITPLPFISDPNYNLRYFICAQSGAGKSHLCASLAEAYVRMYPNQKVIIFSVLDNDPVYDDNEELRDKVKKIDIDDLEGLDVSQLANCLVIFDDDKLLDNKKQKILNSLKNDVFRFGRHYNIDMIACYDKLLGGAETIKQNLHSNFLGYFLHTGGNKSELSHTFKKKMGLEPKQVATLMGGKSRWSLLHKNYPNYLIESNRVVLI